MRYHAIPTPRQLTKSTSTIIRSCVNQFIQELGGTLAKLSKRDANNYPVLFYLHDSKSMADLVHRLMDGDELIVHAEGNPFFIGPVELANPYNLTPFQLALLLSDNKLPDLDINIYLLSCNSATEYEGNNYAGDVSKALNVFFRYNLISVTGYTGFVVVKSNAKFTVSSVLGHSTKGTHADLDSAKIVYKNGQVCWRNKIMIKTLSMMPYSWAQAHIKQGNQERKLIDTIQQASVVEVNDAVPRSRSQDTSFNTYGCNKKKIEKSNANLFFSKALHQQQSSLFSLPFQGEHESNGLS